ncbi:Biopolymer transport protein ExbD/TolR [Parvibaculum lavamentivorans DS-1]|uniref:Biopolymer transport protein ExbD/TolR n=1 Tax=Parvibaculum lavamentivorans (strain DS-1 / DSM 13023 / NCIMB 13966) TaxID=402881 RepID=A7HX65_PARL1|nr:biopolymer transporter ExbD [Parvibaculum lavamentivorans]ABS64498.1 Biopolymer transport protein ExbD/TolR [Parvibaculum lavamentivorans DS-1]
MFEEPVRRRGMASLTPLIDVVFLLLIFFMLTTSFMQTQSLSVVTPAPSADELPTDARVVEIWLMGDGTLRLDGKPVERTALTASLREAIGERKDMTVTILAEKGSRTQALVAAVEAARQSGAKAVGTARVEKIRP